MVIATASGAEDLGSNPTGRKVVQIGSCALLQFFILDAFTCVYKLFTTFEIQYLIIRLCYLYKVGENIAV
jgi:hypothetical protein